MLKLKDLKDFQAFLESGDWQDAFAHADHDLRLEMIEKVEALLEAADVADRVVAQALFSDQGVPQPQGSSTLEDK